MVLSNTSAEDGDKVCERLLMLVRNLAVEASDGRKFGFTLSMGISEFPKDGIESYYLFNRADESLYKSKRAGKNRITVYDGSK